MIAKSKYPILEYDDNRESVIKPIKPTTNESVSQYCVLCFFQEVIDQLKNEYNLKKISEVKTIMGPQPIYQFDYNGSNLVIVQPGLGSAFSAGVLEELIALGCNKFIASGTCGVLLNDIKPGEVIVPTSAIREEGVSYHYLAPAREVNADKSINELTVESLKNTGIPYRIGKIWTSDGFYRETKEKIDLRRKEGCIAIEMEAASLFAVAEFRNVKLGYILVGADDVSGATWDKRSGLTPMEFRKRVIDCCIDTVLEM